MQSRPGISTQRQIDRHHHSSTCSCVSLTLPVAVFNSANTTRGGRTMRRSGSPAGECRLSQVQNTRHPRNWGVIPHGGLEVLFSHSSPPSSSRNRATVAGTIPLPRVLTRSTRWGCPSTTRPSVGSAAHHGTPPASARGCPHHQSGRLRASASSLPGRQASLGVSDGLFDPDSPISCGRPLEVFAIS